MILIRADGNAQIGMGHLMRCMTIAEELALLLGGKDKIHFVCADEASGKFVKENDFRCHILGTDYRDMESELPLWKQLLQAHFEPEAIHQQEPLAWTRKEKSAIKILVDSYHITDRFLTVLREKTYVILLDDMGTHPYPADCIVNYNAPADPEAYQKLYQDTETRLLIGSKYTPLRRQFCRKLPANMESDSRAATKENRDRNMGESNKEDTYSAQIQEVLVTTGGDSGNSVQRLEVLITTGGGDSGNIAGKILERIYDKVFSFHLIMGRFHPHFHEMQELEKRHTNIHLHRDVKDMAGLMRRCQIAITAGGSTIYELAALGIPFICFSYAENQEALVDYIGTHRIAASAGAWHKDPDETLKNIETHFRTLTRHPKLRKQYTKNETKMIDTQGARRLAMAILGIETTTEPK